VDIVPRDLLPLESKIEIVVESDVTNLDGEYLNTDGDDNAGEEEEDDHRLDVNTKVIPKVLGFDIGDSNAVPLEEILYVRFSEKGTYTLRAYDEYDNLVDERILTYTGQDNEYETNLELYSYDNLHRYTITGESENEFELEEYAGEFRTTLSEEQVKEAASQNLEDIVNGDTDLVFEGNPEENVLLYIGDGVVEADRAYSEEESDIINNYDGVLPWIMVYYTPTCREYVEEDTQDMVDYSNSLLKPGEVD
jgi:hypothetical protein